MRLIFSVFSKELLFAFFNRDEDNKSGISEDVQETLA